MKREEMNDHVVEWIVNRVKTEYSGDVSLVLLYGSYVNGTANEKSDVDCCYIPKTERGYGLATGFIIDGVGYDLFPLSWERLEGLADLRESLMPLVGDARIVYCGGAEDRRRFQGLQTRLHSNLANDDYVKKIARERCKAAGRLYGQMQPAGSLSQVRKLAGHVMMFLADGVAIYNHDYFHFGLKRQYEDLAEKFPRVPREIVTGYGEIVTSLDREDTIEKTAALLQSVCSYMSVAVNVPPAAAPGEEGAATAADGPRLARLYEELSSTFQKIYVCCESGNHILAFLSAVCLQRELDDAREAGCPPFDLLNCFDYRHLEKLGERARIIERDLVEAITQGGGHIRSFDTWEAFLQANL